MTRETGARPAAVAARVRARRHRPIAIQTVRSACGSTVVAAGIAAGLLALVAAFVGCGGPTGVATVTGTVTLNGQPLADAMVRFQPTSGGAPSAGTTDSGGRYELRHTRSTLGAVTGSHAVSISTFRAARPDAEPPEPSRPEQLPRKYNATTELTATVTPGGNTIDFQLEATGKILQPKQGDY